MKDEEETKEGKSGVMEGTNSSANKTEDESSMQIPTISCRGLRAASGAVDRDLWLWYCAANKKQAGKKLSKQVVQARAKWAFHRAGITNFKASDGWYRRWISRWHRHNPNPPDLTAKEKTKRNENKAVDSLEILRERDTKELGQEIMKQKNHTQNASLCHVEIPETDTTIEFTVSCDNNPVHTSQDVVARSEPTSSVFQKEPEEISNGHVLPDFSTTLLENNNDQHVIVQKFKNTEHNSLNPDDLLNPSSSDSFENLLYYSAVNGILYNHFLHQPDVESSPLPDHTSSNTIASTSEKVKCNENTVSGNEVQITSLIDNENSTSSENSQDMALLGTCSSSQVVETSSAGLQSHICESVQTKCTDKKNASTSKLQLCKNGKRYLPHFKDKVLSYVANHTFKETAKKFHVHQGSITTWKKDKARKKLTSRRSSGRGKGSTPSTQPIDEQFLAWMRQHPAREVTAAEVQDYARQLVAQCGGPSSAERQARWFALWVHRFEEKPYHEGMENSKHKGEEERRIQYPPAFRMEVAAFADSHSQMRAARIFNVSRKRVFEWLKAYREKKLNGVVLEGSSNSKPGSGRTVKDGDIDKQIWHWYKARLADGSKPKGDEVRSKGLALYRERGHSDIRCSYGWYKRWCDRFGVVLRHDGDDAMLEWTLAQLDRNRTLTHHDLQVQAKDMWSRRSPHFKASPGWAIRFCKRHPKLLQNVPTVHTPLPAAMQRQVEEFRNSVLDLIKSRELPSGAVGNMDELHLNFSAPLCGNSKRQLLLRKPGSENCHATIVLACLADGSMLPPAIVLKNSLDSQAWSAVDSELLVMRQEDGLLDAAGMEQWLDHVWFKQVPGPNLLIADCYDPHLAPSVVEKVLHHQSELVIIPGGCTSKLQPLDISIRQSFQLSIEKQWTQLNNQPANSWNCNNKFHMPTASELLDWVKQTHSLIQANKQEAIRRSFLIMGLIANEDLPTIPEDQTV